MKGTAIASVRAWEALDSRGRPTVACTVTLAGGRGGRAVVPSGASTGRHEATELRDGGDRYAGHGVRRAVEHVNTVLAGLLHGHDVVDRVAVDDLLQASDPDPRLGTLGANAVLAVSLAATLAAADATGRQLWRSLRDDDEPLLPLPMVNVVSGGAHAARAIDIQDVLVVPVGATSFRQAIEWAARVRAAAADLLPAAGGNPALLADEGGLAAPFTRNEHALVLVTDAISRAGLRPADDVAIALDLAASQFFDGERYQLRVDGQSLRAADLIDLVRGWCARYPVISVEDILAEDAWDDWHEATGQLGSAHQVLGDDLFATDAARVRRGIGARVGNAVLVKPNQAGLVTRAERVVATAQRAGYATVVSARSGDTEDHWLADFAVGWHAGQIKVGSTHRSERTAKWNRLLEIEAHAGDRARYAGRAALPL